jgi:hypothetical protein
VAAAPRRDTVLVATGVLIPRTEAAERFDSLPIERYRATMSSAAFEVFVRFAGLIPGDKNTDVVAATELDSD